MFVLHIYYKVNQEEIVIGQEGVVRPLGELIRGYMLKLLHSLDVRVPDESFQ